MTPPNPEDSSLPPRHRPTLETFVKNSREEDLWDLAEPPADAANEAPPVQVLPRRGIPGAPLVPADGPAAATDDAEGPPVLAVAVTPRRQTSQSTNVARLGRVRIMRESDGAEHPLSPLGAPASANLLEDAFDNLEEWDVPDDLPDELPEDGAAALALLQPAAEPLAVPASPLIPSAAATPPPADFTDVPAADAAPADADTDADATATAAADEAAAVSAKPLSLRPHLNLSKVEAIGLLALSLVLLVGGYWVYDHSLSRVLRQAGQAPQISFPVRGTHVTVSSVDTYWREPVTIGSQAEARPGVVLIPVAEITLQGGPGAIRALVYNESGLSVGDPITRPVDGAATLILPATQGFEDVSMHAAYRTGQTKPWTLRIFEAPSADAQGKDFKKLLEIPISSTKR
ncbi:MAG: hypothetical protein WCK77_02965 [Verrucomicrobiota bacterium]